MQHCVHMQMTLPTIQNLAVWRRSNKAKEGRNEVLCKCSAMAIYAKYFFINTLLGTEFSFVNINSTCMKWPDDSCVVCCTWLSNNRTSILLILLFIQQNVQRCLNFHGSLFSTILLHVSQKGVFRTGKSNTYYISSDSVPTLYQLLLGCVCRRLKSYYTSQMAGIPVFFHNIFYLHINTSDFTNVPIPTCLPLFW